MKLFESLARAVLERQEVRFDYQKIDSDAWEARSLRPLHLAEVDGGWYVIGIDNDRNARRTFALQRMKKVRVLKRSFVRPCDFDLTEHLGGSFGVWHRPENQGKVHRIKLRFSGWAARMVSERRWHASQQLRPVGRKGDKNGESVEMVLELSDFEEIIRWILSWGQQVEVIEPPELRTRIGDDLVIAAKLYR